MIEVDENIDDKTHKEIVKKYNLDKFYKDKKVVYFKFAIASLMVVFITYLVYKLNNQEKMIKANGIY